MPNRDELASKLAALVRFNRGDMSVRDLEAKLGVSASTISRVENRHLPDLETFLVLLEWMQMPAYRFLFGEEEPQERDPLERLAMLLEYDLEMEHDFSQAIVTIVRVIREKKGTGDDRRTPANGE